MNARTKPHDGHPYFNDFEELLDEKDRELRRASLRQEFLRVLREKMLEIDCDHGVANLEVDGEIIKAVIDVKNVALGPVDTVLNSYNWDRKFDMSYNRITNTVVFELAGDVDQICDDLVVS